MGDVIDHYVDADGTVVLTGTVRRMKGNWTDDERQAILADIRHLKVMRDSCNPNHDGEAIARWNRYITAQEQALEAFTDRFAS